MAWFTWKRIRATEHLLWLFFLGSLALQARVLLWQADRLFIEWRSAFFYFSDFLFLVLLLFAGLFWLRGERCSVSLSPWDYALGLFVGVAVAGTVSSVDGLVTGVAIVRIVEGLLLYGYVRWYAWGRFNADLSLAAFVLGTLAQSVLGVAQFVLQQHVGLHALGETILYPTMRGVAVFVDLAGEKTLRAYGTLPHPNVLAMFLIFALAGTAYLRFRHTTATVRNATVTWTILVWFLLWGLIATFSRTVIAAAIGAFMFPFVMLMSERYAKSWNNVSALRLRARELFFICLAGVLIFTLLFWPQVLARMGISPHEEAVQLRAYYNVQALHSGEGFLGVNWLGVGAGNFVTWLMEAQPNLPSWQYQPAHNLYLLVYTETGILGLGAFLMFVGLLVRALWLHRSREPLVRLGLLALVGVVLFSALFDHFFWTLQQGRLLWWILWGVVAAYAQHA